MAITTTQRHTPAESVNERTSGRRIDAQQQFVSFRITETGNTDAAGKFTLTHTPIGSLARQFDNLSRINKEPDLVALTALDAPLYSGEFDQANRTIELYADAAKTTPAANLVGAKVSYWYYAPVKGTLNADGTFTPEVSSEDIDTALDDIITGLAAVLVKQDALNGKDFATQATLAAILAKIIAAPSTEAKQDALAALVGEVQAVPSANTLLARLKSLEDKIDAITAGTTPAVMQLSGSNVGVEATDTITLSHTADAHDAGDVISTAAGENLEFAALGAANDHIMITDVTIKYNQDAIPTSHTGYKLHLFNAAPTAIAGDEEFNVIEADLPKYLGYISIAALTDIGNYCISNNDGINKRVKLVGTGLYGQLQCIADETPAIDSVFTVIIGGFKL